MNEILLSLQSTYMKFTSNYQNNSFHNNKQKKVKNEIFIAMQIWKVIYEISHLIGYIKV